MTMLLTAGTRVRVIPADASGEVVTYRDIDGARIYSVLTKTGNILDELRLRDLADEEGRPFVTAGADPKAPSPIAADLACVLRLAPAIANGRAIRAPETAQLRAFAALAGELADLMERILDGDAEALALARQVLAAAGRRHPAPASPAQVEGRA
jgi:hypothetical protein